MRKAFAVLVLVDVAMNLVSPAEDLQKFGLANLILSLLMMCSISYFLVYLLKSVTNTVDQQTEGSLGLGVWSYVWRVYLVKSLSLTVFVFIYVLLNRGIAPVPSVGLSFLMAASTFVTSIPLTWLFFSKDRRGHLLWAVQLFRGIG
jgi:hypothetical protein